jgi:hypothetical protein
MPRRQIIHQNHGRMVRGGHGLPKVSPGPTMTYPSTPWPPLKRPYSLFKGGQPAGRAASDHLLPLWTPHAERLWMPQRQIIHRNVTWLHVTCQSDFQPLDTRPRVVEGGGGVRDKQREGAEEKPEAYGVGCSKGKKTAAGHPPCRRAILETRRWWPARRA